MTDRGFRPDGVDHPLPDHDQPDPPTNITEGASASVAIPASSPQPKTEASLAFLSLYSFGKPIVLTAIVPDGGAPVESETFTPGPDDDAIHAWLEARQGRRNLYFHVNGAARKLSGPVKAKKTDIKWMKALHVSSARSKFGIRLIERVAPKRSRCGFWSLDRAGRRDCAIVSVMKLFTCWKVIARFSSMMCHMRLARKPEFICGRDKH